MTISKKLAQYIIQTNYEDIPKDVREFTKICILDWIGSAYAGRKTQPIQIIKELVEEQGGSPQATLITGGSSSVLNAALLNGASSHVVELDDIHKSSIIHAATVVIPAALAVAEWKNKSGKDLIAAVTIGYEVCYRIGEAVSPSHYYYWHNTATCGTFGAAAAAAKLLELNEEQTIHALGSAGTQAAGLWEFIEDSAMSKQLHPGKAAMNGVMSALLSKKGFTAARKILEGKRGFFEAMSENYKLDKITNKLGEVFKIKENSFKIHASCRHTHSAMDLAIELANDHDIRVEDVEKVNVQTYQVALNITNNPNPMTVYGAKFSLQFCTALALVKRRGALDDFNEKMLHDTVIRELIDKINVGVDPEIEERYPIEWGSKVQIKLTNGKAITKKTRYPKGDPENPASLEEMIGKFKQLTKNLPPKQADWIVEKVMKLENITHCKNLLKGTAEWAHH